MFRMHFRKFLFYLLKSLQFVLCPVMAIKGLSVHHPFSSLYFTLGSLRK